MRKFLIYIFLVSGFGVFANPVADFNQRMQTAFEMIVEMRFNEAKVLVAAERKENPDNRVCDYLEGAMIYGDLFVNEDQKSFENYEDQLESLMDRIEDLDDSEPQRNLFLGEMYTAQAILNGKYGNNISAAWQFYKAYDYLSDNHEDFPGHTPTYIPLGVMYAAIGSLPDDYQGLASLLGFKGSVSEGMSLLKRAFEDISTNPDLAYYKSYAGFIYSYVDYQLGDNPELSPEDLGLDVSSSGFLIYLQAMYEVKKGHPEKAVYWLNNKPAGPKYLSFNYLHYLSGKTMLGIDNANAKREFDIFLAKTKSKVYVKSTYRYLSWYYMLTGDKVKADEMREKVTVYGTLNTGADRQAMEENNHPLNPNLIRARLYYDAADYERALRILNSANVNECCITPREKVEYYYRVGSVYLRMKMENEAVASYSRALFVNEAPATYALGNSALQLGLIYEGRGNDERARESYKKCLKISKYPFYEGVHQKAKAGLNRLSN